MAASISTCSGKGGRRAGRGFTLVELLVVVAIIALLIAIIMPSLTHVREMARKVSCKAQLSAYGKALAQYVSHRQAYPHFGPGGIGIIGGSSTYAGAWPKFWAILEQSNIAGTHDTNWGVKAYILEADEVWKKAFCPSMDAAAILAAADAAVAADPLRLSYDGKPSLHCAAAGYQWNKTLRAATPHKRWPNALQGWPEASDNDDTLWLDYPVHMADGSGYATQAVNLEEISQPSTCAEAWDSWDLGTAPNVSIDRSYDVECIVPGWHVGPMSAGTDGWALLNGDRHQGSPSILYVDSHVASDARQKIDPSSDLGACPAGNWNGLKAVSWSDYRDFTWGTMWHIVPQLEFVE